LACHNDNLNVVQFLFQRGYDMDVGDNKGRTGFHLACHNDNLNVVQFLVQQGFDINLGDDDETTGFCEACSRGNLNVIRYLLHEGCDWNLRNDEGRTGFHEACSNSEYNMVQFLVQQGFKGINEVGLDGMTGLALLIQQQNRHRHANDEFFMPCVLLLIEVGAELNENDVFEELIPAIQNRIIEITFMKERLFEKWTGRIAQAITDFTMEPFTNASLQNLSIFLD